MDTIYTKCDYQIEKKLHRKLNCLENEFRDHYTFHLNEMKKQIETIDRLWVVAQRYLILTRSVPCLEPYPEVVSTIAQEETLTKFHEILETLHCSNHKLCESLEHLKASCYEFDEISSKIDLSVPSKFIQGDKDQKSIFYFIELISDLFQYLYTMQCKQNCSANRIHPNCILTIEDYKKLLNTPPSEDFEEYFYSGLAYCKRIKLEFKT